MRKAGDVCFSQVFRDRGGELIGFYDLAVTKQCCFCNFQDIASLNVFSYLVVMGELKSNLLFRGSMHFTFNESDLLNDGKFAGMTGIVDYTNYDDMKYAVSCCQFFNITSAW